MAKLIGKVEKVTIIDSNDFDDFVNETYGGDFEFVAVHEANNYSQYRFNVPNMAMLFGDDAKNIRSGKYKTHCVHQLFKCLYEDGHIKKGNYTINVSW